MYTQFFCVQNVTVLHDTPICTISGTIRLCTTPLSASLTSPLTGETYSQNLRYDSTSNKLSLFIASDVSTTNSFYGVYACKNWVLASGRGAELVPKGHRLGGEGITYKTSSLISRAIIAFCTCNLFSAWSKTKDCGPSRTSSVISSPRCAGRQCSTIASGRASFSSS